MICKYMMGMLTFVMTVSLWGWSNIHVIVNAMNTPVPGLLYFR